MKTTRLLIGLFLCVVVAVNASAQQQNLPSSITQGFRPNKGQVLNQFGLPENDVLFIANFQNLQVQLRKTGFSLQLSRSFPQPTVSPTVKAFNSRGFDGDSYTAFHRVDYTFMGGNASFQTSCFNASGSYDNYYINGSEITGVKAYARVLYENVYPGTDIEFLCAGGNTAGFKYNIILRPGANLNVVKFLVQGPLKLSLSNTGNLVSETSLGNLQEQIPYSYYTDNGQSLKVLYSLVKNELSFDAEYDNQRTLVIDPVSNLIWSTYYGGTGIEFCHSIDADAQNNVYFCGHSNSSANIATAGAFQTTLTALFDAYIVKLNAAGVRQWGTYLGAGGGDIFYAINARTPGGIYVCGSTTSSTGIASTGAHQTTYGGGVDDVLLAKFNTAGQRQWCTYYGGPKHDIAQAITVDKQGNIVFTGHTESASGITTAGAYSTVYNLNFDVFVAKFSPNGNQLWGTYYGDSDVDEAFGIAHDSNNNIVVTGVTRSISGIAFGQSHQVVPGGVQDGFIAKFNPTGSTVLWSTFYGGSGDDFGVDAETDQNDNIYVCGVTTSSNNMVSAGASQTVQGSYDDSFLASFTASGTRRWSTYFGGEDSDYINDIDLDGGQNLVLAGATVSNYSISTPGAFQPSIATQFGYDSFICQYTTSGNKLLGTYFGGSGNDFAKSMTIDGLGKIYIAGETNSTSGLATAGAHATVYAGSNDAFVAKFCIPFTPKITPSASSTVCVGVQTLSAPAGYSTYVWNGTFSVNPLVVQTTTVPGTYTFCLFANDGFGCTGTSDTTVLNVSACLSVNENDPDTELQLYPNPTNGHLYISLPDNPVIYDYELSVFAGDGRQVMRQAATAQVDVASLPEGLYLLRLAGKDKIFQEKFIKN